MAKSAIAADDTLTPPCDFGSLHLGFEASLHLILSFPSPTLLNMNRQGGEAFAKLIQQLNRARLQAAGNGGRPGGGGGGGPLPKGTLAAGGLAVNYSIFNGMWIPCC
jgi:hypothetical protein